MSVPLVVLTADVDIEAAVRTLIEKRWRALRISQVSAKYLRHPNKDPGCYSNSMEYLRGFADVGGNALVVFDEAWDGHPASAPEIERSVERSLAGAWAEKADRTVFPPTRREGLRRTVQRSGVRPTAGDAAEVVSGVVNMTSKEPAWCVDTLCSAPSTGHSRFRVEPARACIASAIQKGTVPSSVPWMMRSGASSCASSSIG